MNRDVTDCGNKTMYEKEMQKSAHQNSCKWSLGI